MNINLKKDQLNQKEKTPEKEPVDKGMTAEAKKDAKAIASRRVRLSLILSEIGRQNSIKVEEDDKKRNDERGSKVSVGKRKY